MRRALQNRIALSEPRPIRMRPRRARGLGKRGAAENGARRKETREEGEARRTQKSEKNAPREEEGETEERRSKRGEQTRHRDPPWKMYRSGAIAHVAGLAHVLGLDVAMHLASASSEPILAVTPSHTVETAANRCLARQFSLEFART